jgi:hypothetical protein
MELQFPFGDSFKSFDIEKSEHKPLNEHSCSYSSGAATPPLSDDETDQSDYGLYEDLEESDAPSNAGESFLPSVPSFESRTRVLRPQKNQDMSRTIVYTFNRCDAHVICRSFDKAFQKSLAPVSVCISTTAVRIVQDTVGLHPEFCVKMRLGSQEHTAWRALHEFKAIANACLKFSSKKRKSMFTSIFSPTTVEDNIYEVSPSILLKNTNLAWEKVLLVASKRDWFGRFSVTSLIAESQALECFLENLLFEIPDIDILIEFLR